MRRLFLTAEVTAEPADDSVHLRISVDSGCAFRARSGRWWTTTDERDRAVGSNPTSSANPLNRLQALIRRPSADEFDSTHDSRTWNVLCFLSRLAFVTRNCCKRRRRNAQNTLIPTARWPRNHSANQTLIPAGAYHIPPSEF